MAVSIEQILKSLHRLDALDSMTKQVLNPLPQVQACCHAAPMTLQLCAPHRPAGYHLHPCGCKLPAAAETRLHAGHRKAVSYVKFKGPDHVVSASTDSTLRLWSLAGGQGASDAAVYDGHINDKNFVGLATQGDFLACGSETNEVLTIFRLCWRLLLGARALLAHAWSFACCARWSACPEIARAGAAESGQPAGDCAGLALRKLGPKGACCTHACSRSPAMRLLMSLPCPTSCIAAHVSALHRPCRSQVKFTPRWPASTSGHRCQRTQLHQRTHVAACLQVFVYHHELTKPIAVRNFGRPHTSQPHQDHIQHFISAVAWRPGSQSLLAANSQGVIQVLQLPDASVPPS